MTFLTEDDRKLSEYIGDGVYIRTGTYLGEVVIFTSDGIHRTNDIRLDSRMMETLAKWWKRKKQEPEDK